MQNRYANYHANEQVHQKCARKRRQKRTNCDGEFMKLFANSGCVFAYERLGIYKVSRKRKEA